MKISEDQFKKMLTAAARAGFDLSGEGCNAEHIAPGHRLTIERKINDAALRVFDERREYQRAGGRHRSTSTLTVYPTKAEAAAAARLADPRIQTVGEWADKNRVIP